MYYPGSGGSWTHAVVLTCHFLVCVESDDWLTGSTSTGSPSYEDLFQLQPQFPIPGRLPRAEVQVGWSGAVATPRKATAEALEVKSPRKSLLEQQIFQESPTTHSQGWNDSLQDLTTVMVA